MEASNHLKIQNHLEKQSLEIHILFREDEIDIKAFHFASHSFPVSLRQQIGSIASQTGSYMWNTELKKKVSVLVSMAFDNFSDMMRMVEGDELSMFSVLSTEAGIFIYSANAC